MPNWRFKVLCTHKCKALTNTRCTKCKFQAGGYFWTQNAIELKLLIKCVTRKGFSRTQSYFFELLRFSSLKYSLSLDTDSHNIENLKINNQEDYVKRNANKSTFIVSSKIKSFDKFDPLLKMYSVILTSTSNSNTQIDRNMFGDWQNVHWISNEFGINGRFLWLLLLLSPEFGI